MTLSITTLGITTLSIMTLNITTLGITTLSLATLYIERHYAECHDLFIVMLNVVMLNVMAPHNQHKWDKIISEAVLNLSTLKAGAEHELLFNELASGFVIFHLKF